MQSSVLSEKSVRMVSKYACSRFVAMLTCYVDSRPPFLHTTVLYLSQDDPVVLLMVLIARLLRHGTHSRQSHVWETFPLTLSSVGADRHGSKLCSE